MFNSNIKSHDDLFLKHLKSYTLILTCMLLGLVVLNFLYFDLFKSISKFIIFGLAFYLLISSSCTHRISHNLYLSLISFFYGLINVPQILHIILPEVLGLSPFEVSYRIYFVGRISFAFILMIISYMYAHKSKQLKATTIYLAIVFAIILISSFQIIDEQFILFLRGHSIGSLLANLINHITIPGAFLFSFFQLIKCKDDFKFTHKIVMLLFVSCSLIMETVDGLYFFPLTAPIIYNNLFKISTLSLLVIGQIDCCILRPFYSLYTEKDDVEKLVSDRNKELYQYSNHVKKLEDVIQSKTSSYEMLINLIPEPFLVCAGDKILDLNPAAFQLFKVSSKHDLIGQSILSFIHTDSNLPSEFDSLSSAPNQILRGQGQLTTPTHYIYDIEYLFTTSSLYNGKNIICLIHDITLRQKQHAAQKALEQQHLKLNYFSSISHDIKTPINIIYSSLQMQTHAINLNECTHYTGIMQQNCLKLLKLLNNLLDLTKIENEMLHVSPQYFDAIDAVETLCEISYYYMKEKEMTYIFDTDMDEKIVYLDPSLLERIIFNPLSNAIKYTPAGGHIEVSILEAHESIVLTVKDTGVGIPANKLDSIFDRFTTVAKNAHSSKEHSCGIGLSVVRDLVSLLEGTIRCESTVDEGSSFIITLPAPDIEYDLISGPYTTSHNTHNIKIEFCDL